MSAGKFIRTFSIIGLAILALAGCRAGEEGRPIRYEPGVYRGKNPDKPLSEGQLATLRQRSLEQGGIPVGGLPSGGGVSTKDVRPPMRELDTRNLLQGNN